MIPVWLSPQRKSHFSSNAVNQKDDLCAKSRGRDERFSIIAKTLKYRAPRHGLPLSRLSSSWVLALDEVR